MPTLAPRQSLAFSARPAERAFASAAIPVNPLTAQVTVRLRRPTTAAPLAWDAASKLRVTIIVALDGQEYRCVGSTSGGIRRRPDGTEIGEYRLRYTPPVMLQDGVAKRLGQMGRFVTARVLIEQVTGTVQTELLEATTVEAPAPSWLTHSSVAFDAATDAQESAGDGQISLSHTSTGSNRAVFGAGAWDSLGTPGSTSMTYGATGMTEKWDAVVSGNWNHAGYTLVNQATGAQTVTWIVASGVDTQWQMFGVVSLTGVDQTTPNGTAQTATGATTTATVTVTGLTTDGMIVDSMITNTGDTVSVGADQTQRNTETFGTAEFRQSTQSSNTAGGVMSWSVGAADFWGIGAIEFKPVVAPVSDPVPGYRQMVVTP